MFEFLWTQIDDSKYFLKREFLETLFWDWISNFSNL